MHAFFDFRVLRENRRVVKDENGTAARQADLENFHRVLMNISEGKATQRVRDFIVLLSGTVCASAAPTFPLVHQRMPDSTRDML